MDAEARARRIDDQLERSNELMARIDASLARNSDAHARDHEVLARNEQAFLDLRTYMQQATTALGFMVTDLREGRREQSESWQDWREEWNEWRKAWREESRAFLEALFSILDRLNQDPPPNAA